MEKAKLVQCRLNKENYGMDKKGKVVLELGPSAGNPRNSEGAFIDLPDGRLLFVYSRFIGDSNADDAPSCIASRYSGDGGET
jgi:hypothetical protein